MSSDVAELMGKLFKRGFNPDGIVYILRLLAAEHVEGSDRRRDLELAAESLLE